MKKNISWLLNGLLLAAVLFYGSVFLVLLLTNGTRLPARMLAGDFIQIILGLAVFALACVRTHRAYHYFLSLLLVFWGSIVMFVSLKQNVYGMKQLWPVFGVAGGVAWYLSGFLKYKKNRFSYTIPSLTLVVLGLWFMLFSFKVIKIPFKDVVIIVGPVFFGFLIIFLIAIFLLQQKYKALVVTDEQEDEDALTAE